MTVDTSFLPSLSPFDIQRAAELIQQAYAPQTSAATTENLKKLQHELFELQKRPEAWGLVIPLLDHVDMNVQFFGAHTAQVKIARDWDYFPSDHGEALRDLLVHLTAHSMATGRSKVILRKLWVAVTSLALKLVPGHPSHWPDWIMRCVVTFSECNAPADYIHDFLAIVAEEASNADLLGSSKMQMQQSLSDAVPIVVQAVQSAVQTSRDIPSALRLLQAWIPLIPSSDITPLIPPLIALLDTYNTHPDTYLATTDALQELLSKSALADGAGARVLTEPLLLWLDVTGSRIVDRTLTTGEVDDVSRALCKLLVALGDHSTTYLALNIVSPIPVFPLASRASPTPSPGPGSRAHSPFPQAPQLGVGPAGVFQMQQQKTKGHLTQTFLRLLLAYTGLPGYYGVDEEESEMTLGFWYLFQEALWSTDYSHPDGEGGDACEEALFRVGFGPVEGERGSGETRGNHEEHVAMAQAVYRELVGVLRRKVAFPAKGSGWSKDQVDKFQVYRRDVGDTLINAYYVIRDDMIQYYLDDILQRLAARQEIDGWQEIEATLHCITSIQEALDFSKPLPQLSRIFGPEILGRLPQTGHGRIRRTTLGFIGAYASWFAGQPPSHEEFLMSVLTYVASALTDPSLCLQAANALRNLCDANRMALAPQIGAFAQLHAALGSIPDSEKGKVVQSIASVIQALTPMEEIQPIEAIVNPIVQKLHEAMRSSSTLPEDIPTVIVHQLETLSGVAKGLTRSTDGLLIFQEQSEETLAKTEEMARARADPRVVQLRKTVEQVVRNVVEMWSADAAVGIAISDLFKSITALPSDATLISLAPGPLLELVCIAARRQLTGVWLALAAILIAQLNSAPPLPLLSHGVRPVANPEADTVVRSALPILLECTLGTLGASGAMEANPDIVQEFFACMDRTAQDFTRSFYSLPPGALDALINCAIAALALQERYSLVSACAFLSVLIQRTSTINELTQDKELFMQAHGKRIMKAVLEGFASVAPRSVVPNLIDLLGTLLAKAGGGLGAGGGAGGAIAARWMRDILFAEDFIPSKATSEIKEKFVKAVVHSRSLKKTRDAAQQFTLVARGLEGSAFGYASVSM